MRWRARVAEIPGVTVVTNSIGLAEVLHRIGRRDQTVILTGGTRTPSEALVGPFAVAQLRSIHVDLVFMGVHGMDAQGRVHAAPTCSRPRPTSRSIEAGRRLVVLADHTKWGVVGIASIARLDQADILVTDRHSTPRRARPCSTEHVGRIIVADPDGDATASWRRRRSSAQAAVASPRRPGGGSRRPSPPAVRTDASMRPDDAAVDALEGEPHRRLQRR